jgi:hypothetical protein
MTSKAMRSRAASALPWPTGRKGRSATTWASPCSGAFHNGAQPIDQFVFRVKDGHLVYDLRRVAALQYRQTEGGTSRVSNRTPTAPSFKEITPSWLCGRAVHVYPCRGNTISCGRKAGWGGPDYRVAYASGGLAVRPVRALWAWCCSRTPTVATGAGHHSLMQVPDTDDWYIVYHRRPLTETHRQPSGYLYG